ncbi:MAG: methyltransferase domain-containing protein [Dehalococcoidia bacterium]
MPGKDRQQPQYLAHVVPGLETIAAHELRLRAGRAGQVRALRGFDERTSILAFPFDGPTTDLLMLRTVEDLFALGAEAQGIPWTYAGLRAAQQAVTTSQTLEMAAALVLEARGHRPHKPTFRVIARKAGDHAFRRVDLQHAVERALIERFPAWRAKEENASLELWVHLIEDHFILGLRLSGATLRQRTYKQVSLPASLKPTVAAAMALLSQPQPEDVVLDPMCGAGTILIERAEAGRYRQLLGGDSDPAAVTATRANVGPRHQPIELRRWDARALPIEDGSVSVVISNLPFGRKVGWPAELRTLYPALIAEWSRVTAPGGRMVLLTSETALLETAVRGQREMRIVDRIRVLVRGQPAAIHLVHADGSHR